MIGYYIQRGKLTRRLEKRGVIDINLVELIRAKKQEQDYLLRVLELWAAAEAQGIDPTDDANEGGSFGLDTRLLTPKQKVEWQQHNDRFVERDATGASRPKLYNYFCDSEDRFVILYPMLEAVHRESFT
jgi:hypothetical protein